MRVFVLATATLLLTACSSTGPAAQRFTGLYADGFEMRVFTADGSKETWWVRPEPQAQAALNAAKGPNAKPFGYRIRCEIEGRLSPPGHYGHMGMNPRELTITRVISAKLEAAP